MRIRSRKIVLAAAVAALATASAPGVAKAALGDIFVTDFEAGPTGKGVVVKLNPQSGAQTLVSPNPVSAATNLEDPFGITVNQNGDLFVADGEAIPPAKLGAVVKVSQTTGAQTIVSQGQNFDEPTGIEVDSKNDLIVTDVNTGASEPNGRIIKVNPTTGAQTLLSPPAGTTNNLQDPTDVAIASNGDLLVTDANLSGLPTDTNGKVVRVNPTSGQQTVLTTGNNLLDPLGIAITKSGEVFVTEPGPLGVVADGKIVKVDATSGAQTVFATGGQLYDPTGIEFEPQPIPAGSTTLPAGNLLVADQSGPGVGAAGRVTRVNPSSAQQTVLAEGGNLTNDPWGVAVEKDLTLPIISKVTASPKKIFAKAQSAAKKKKKKKKRLNFRYTLSEAAAVKFTIAKRTKAKKYADIGSFDVTGKSGTNKKKFNGKLNGRKLKKGKYRATLVATDSYGNVSTSAKVTFKVKKKKKRKKKKTRR